MSVDQRKVVDFVGIDKADGRAMLTISDHLPWLPDDGHLAVLQDKINDYLGFIESGEIYDAYPQAHGREIEIQVICKYPPVGDAVRFLEFAGDTVRAAGYRFSSKTREVSDDDEG
jgi:hypothetical protein